MINARNSISCVFFYAKNGTHAANAVGALVPFRHVLAKYCQLWLLALTYESLEIETIMKCQDEIREILSKDPENFQALYELARSFSQEKSYAACFAMADRAIASYEVTPVEGEQNHFFELKRLHALLLREHMFDIVGPAASMLDPRWKPVFKLGRPRELALCIGTHHLPILHEALCANQLKRLRFLNLRAMRRKPSKPFSTVATILCEPCRSRSTKCPIWRICAISSIPSRRISPTSFRSNCDSPESTTHSPFA